MKDAVAKGGRVVVAGHRIGDRFFALTLVADANAPMLWASEGTFGPFATVFRFHTQREVIDAANDTTLGLASYLYSRDVGRNFRVGGAQEYGMIGINVGILATKHVPFGGPQ